MLDRAQLGLAGQIGVVFAVIGMKARIFGLEARQRKHRLVQCKRRLLEDVRPEQLLQIVGIGGVLETLEQLIDAVIVHLVRIEQRTERLGLERIGAAVVVEAALRNVRFGSGACRGVRVALATDATLTPLAGIAGALVSSGTGSLSAISGLGPIEKFGVCSR